MATKSEAKKIPHADCTIQLKRTAKEPPELIFKKDPVLIRSKPKNAEAPQQVRWHLTGANLEAGEIIVINPKQTSQRPPDGDYPTPEVKKPSDDTFAESYVLDRKNTRAFSGLANIPEDEGCFAWAYNITLLLSDGTPVSYDPWVVVTKP